LTEARPDQKRESDDPTEWVDRHGAYLYNLAFSRLHDAQATEDVVQETFLAGLHGRSTFAGRSSERTWLVGILKNKIVDHLRRTFRDAPADDIDPDTVEPGLGFHPTGEWTGHWHPHKGPVEWGNDPSLSVQKREFWEILDRCMKKISPRLGSVFILHEIEEMPSGNICKELEITPTNLWVMLHRARRQLRHCLELNWIKGASPKPGKGRQSS
jgi:RNA polymerase sigma-70 factor (ECF subfamily)